MTEEDSEGAEEEEELEDGGTGTEYQNGSEPENWDD